MARAKRKKPPDPLESELNGNLRRLRERGFVEFDIHDLRALLKVAVALSQTGTPREKIEAALTLAIDDYLDEAKIETAHLWYGLRPKTQDTRGLEAGKRTTIAWKYALAHDPQENRSREGFRTHGGDEHFEFLAKQLFFHFTAATTKPTEPTGATNRPSVETPQTKAVPPSNDVPLPSPETDTKPLIRRVLQRWRWALLGGVVLVAAVLALVLVQSGSPPTPPPQLPIPQQLDAVRSQFARAGFTVIFEHDYELKVGIPTYVFVLESTKTKRMHHELRLYDVVSNQLRQTFAFSPEVHEPDGENRSSEPVVIGTVRFGSDLNMELVFDLSVGTETVRQVLPLILTWNEAQQRYNVQPLVRTSVRLTPTRLKEATSRYLQSQAIRLARFPYTVTNRLTHSAFTGYGFGSYYIKGGYILAAFRLSTGSTNGTLLEVQLWNIAVSADGTQFAFGPCSVGSDNNTTNMLDYVPLAPGDDYASSLAAFANKYHDYLSQNGCNDPF